MLPGEIVLPWRPNELLLEGVRRLAVPEDVVEHGEQLDDGVATVDRVGALIPDDGEVLAGCDVVPGRPVVGELGAEPTLDLRLRIEEGHPAAHGWRLPHSGVKSCSPMADHREISTAKTGTLYQLAPANRGDWRRIACPNR